MKKHVIIFILFLLINNIFAADIFNMYGEKRNSIKEVDTQRFIIVATEDEWLDKAHLTIDIIKSELPERDYSSYYQNDLNPSIYPLKGKIVIEYRKKEPTEAYCPANGYQFIK